MSLRVANQVMNVMVFFGDSVKFRNISHGCLSHGCLSCC
jgi:hypothetical protein